MLPFTRHTRNAFNALISIGTIGVVSTLSFAAAAQAVQDAVIGKVEFKAEKADGGIVVTEISIAE